MRLRGVSQARRESRWGNPRRLLSISRRYSPGIQSSRHKRKNTAGFVAFFFFFLRDTPKEIAALLFGHKVVVGHVRVENVKKIKHIILIPFP